ncbi:hypothetical protein M513_06977, partial [Trichuris suis]
RQLFEERSVHSAAPAVVVTSFSITTSFAQRCCQFTTIHHGNCAWLRIFLSFSNCKKTGRMAGHFHDVRRCYNSTYQRAQRTHWSIPIICCHLRHFHAHEVIGPKEFHLPFDLPILGKTNPFLPPRNSFHFNDYKLKSNTQEALKFKFFFE